MKEEYNFSKGIRGKFYREDAVFHLPIYLEPEVENFINKLAKKQKKNSNEVVNMLLIRNKELIQSLNPHF